MTTPAGVPADWPAAGPIDLHNQDAQHKSSALERWYFDGHLHINGSPSSSPPFSFFVSFFKGQLIDNFYPACGLTWAIIDTRVLEEKGVGKYHTDSVLDSTSVLFLKTILEREQHGMDKPVADLLLSYLQKGILPGPDRAHDTYAKFSLSPSSLFFDFGGGSLSRDNSSGIYSLKCENSAKDIMLDLELLPQREAVRRAHEGVMKVGSLQEDMFQYYIPKLSISGKMSVPSLAKKADRVKENFEVSGEGWYTHEFGGNAKTYHQSPEKKASLYELKDSYAWNWFSLQLSNNTEIAASHLFDPTTNEILDDAATITSSNERKEHLDLKVEVLSENWMSFRTGLHFPTKYKLTIPSAKVDLIIEAAMEDQEFVSYIGKPVWKGRVHVSGAVDGSIVSGYGFLETNPGQSAPNLKQFTISLGKEIFRQVEMILPFNPTFEQACNIACSPEHKHLMNGLDTSALVEAIVKPLRTILDRGGKHWRSYILAACIDSVGGDSHKFRRALGLLEIVQGSSLIFDDIADESDQRRGGPSCHKVHGVPLALNAATAALFIPLNVMQDTNNNKYKLIPDEFKASFYDQYVTCMRAAFSGQGMDILGLDYIMPHFIESGDNSSLVLRLESFQKLKTAVPIGFVARFGATCGEGTPKQVEVLGKYFEAVGLAYQIIDDVINLRGGFVRNSKIRGDDISAGKISHPVAMAMSSKFVPTKEARQSIYDRVRSKPNPYFYQQKMTELQTEIDNLAGKDGCEVSMWLMLIFKIVSNEDTELKELQEQYELNQKLHKQHEEILFKLIDELEECGAVEASNERGYSIMAEAWKELDSVIEDSRYKILLKLCSQFDYFYTHC